MVRQIRHRNNRKLCELENIRIFNNAELLKILGRCFFELHTQLFTREEEQLVKRESNLSRGRASYQEGEQLIQRESNLSTGRATYPEESLSSRRDTSGGVTNRVV